LKVLRSFFKSDSFNLLGVFYKMFASENLVLICGYMGALLASLIVINVWVRILAFFFPRQEKEGLNDDC
jgi:hypothetical protein